MSADFSLDSTSKKRKRTLFDNDKCVFCSQGFTSKNPARNPELSKIASLFAACCERQDDIGNKLLAHENKISLGEVSIQYHKNCRSTYCSPAHIKRVVSKRSCSSACSSVDSGGGHAFLDASATLTRSKISPSAFDWKNNCFICGERCNPKHRYSWSMVEASIDNVPETENMYTKTVAAAKRRNDQTMLTRLFGVANGDLVAVEARYHRQKGCYPRYINDRNIKAQEKESATESSYQSVVKTLVDEFRPAIINEKQVFVLSTLRSRFHELATEAGVENPERYRSFRLKRQLIQECPEISFVPQPGMSDIVCSSEISVGDALRKLSDLVKSLKSTSEEIEQADAKESPEEEPDEVAIVHKAVGILRRRMTKSAAQPQNYPSPDDMTVASLKDFVDPLLYKAIGWLTNKDLFSQAADIADDDQIQCLNFACDITTLATSTMSPKHLGLAIHFHHEFGSRKLVEHMFSLGYSVSYSELRRFLTSAALQVSATQTARYGSFVPPQVLPKESGGKMVIGVGDNWDHNERTVDGKRTTHAMTSILVTPMVQDDIRIPPIPRAPDRCLDLTLVQGSILIPLVIDLVNTNLLNPVIEDVYVYH